MGKMCILDTFFHSTSVYYLLLLGAILGSGAQHRGKKERIPALIRPRF